MHGRLGAVAPFRPVDGENGAPGSLRIFVQSENGHLNGPYSSIYQLTLNDFDIFDNNEDGILEFGEEVTLRNFVVRNTGSTPSMDSSHYL